MTIKITTRQLGSLVDELSRLRADKAELAKRERAITDTLKKEIGVHHVFEGKLFRAAVVRQVSNVLDTARIRANQSRQWLKAYTVEQTSERVETNSRIGDKAAA